MSSPLKRFSTGNTVRYALLLLLATFSVAAAGPRYLVDVRDNARAFVIAYDAVQYTVDGGGTVSVGPDSVAKVNLSSSNGPYATVELSGPGGYVVSVADSSDYVGDNSSNDNMVLARGRNGYVDTEFLVYNHVAVVGEQTPAKMVITAQESAASVDIDDLTDDSDDQFGLSIPSGTSVVVDLSGPSVLKVTATANVSVYYGIIDDGSFEVMPTVGGGFVGTEAYIATPGFVGVVAGGDGYIRISERVALGELVIENKLAERRVSLGDALFVPHVRSGSSYSGVTTVKVAGTAPFYTFAGIGEAGSSYFGASYMPPVPGFEGRLYAVQTPHPERDATLEVIPVSNTATAFSVYKVSQFDLATARAQILAGESVTVGTPLNGSYNGPVGEYTIEASTYRNQTFKTGLVEYLYVVQAAEPAMVQVRHATTVERGGVAISPDFVPETPPSIGAFDVTGVWQMDSATDTSPDEYLRVRIDVLDVNQDLVGAVLTDPTGMPVDLSSYLSGVPGPEPNEYARIVVNTGFPGMSYAYRPGTYTLTLTDALGNTTVRTDSLRDFRSLAVGPSTVASPDDGSIGANVQPVYQWTSPKVGFSSTYAIQVAPSADLENPVVAFDSSMVLGLTSLAHGAVSDEPLALNTQYTWQVASIASTLEWGDDFAVIGPQWTFTTSESMDTTAPRFVVAPRTVGVRRDTLTVNWTTDEPTSGELSIFTPDGAPFKSFIDREVQREHYVTANLGLENGVAFKVVATATDASDNSTVSDTVVVLIDAESDSVKPLFTSGPVTLSVTNDKATISWSTDEVAAYQLDYFIQGTDPISNPEVLVTRTNVEDFLNSWEVELSDLLPDTVYYYQVQSVDGSNNIRVSRLFQFHTLAEPDSIPPNIIGVPRVVPSGTYATVVWQTDEGATGRVRYGEGSPSSLPRSAASTEDLSTSQQVRLTGLLEGTRYYFNVVAVDGERNEARSDTLSFWTLRTDDQRSPTIAPVGAAGENRGLVLVSQGVASVLWQTDEETSGQVFISTDNAVNDGGALADIGSIVKKVTVPASAAQAGASGGYEFRIDLEGLTVGPQYYAQIVVLDGAGNVAVGAPIPFVFPETEGEDTQPPTVLHANVTSSLRDSATVFSLLNITTSELTEAEVRFSTKHYLVDQGQTAIPLTGGQMRNHTFGANLIPGTQYFYKIYLVDRAGNGYSDSSPRSFVTPTRVDEFIPELLSIKTNVTRRQNQSEGGLDSSGTVIARINAQFDRDVQITAFVVPVDEFDNPELPAIAQLSTARFNRNHVLSIPGLDPGTKYALLLLASSPSRNLLVWPEGSQVIKTAHGYEIAKIAIGRGSTFSTTVTTDETNPVIVSAPLVVAKTASSLTVSWETDEPADSRVRYRILADEGSAKLSVDPYPNELVDPATVTQHTVYVAQLDSNSIVEFEIGSTDEVGNGESTSSTQVVVLEEDESAPVIVEGPKLLSLTDERAVVKWVTDEASDGQIEVLERGQPTSEKVVFQGEYGVTEHVITLTNLAANTEYDYYISSTDQSGNGPATASGEFLTETEPDAAAPVIVEAPSVIHFDDVSAKISWRTDEAADTYIEYGTTEALGLKWESVQRDTAHLVTLTNLTPGTQYFYRIQAEDASGNIYEQVASSSFTTDTNPDLSPPAAPANFSALASDAQVYLSWDANTEPDLSGYTIERAGGSGVYQKIVTGLRTESYLDRNVVNDSTYTYRLTAVDDSYSGNESTPSVSSAVSPLAGIGPEIPQFGPVYFLYYDVNTEEGEPYRPVFRVANVPDVERAGAVMTYEFVVSTDSTFGSTMITSPRISPGDSVVGTFETWILAWINGPIAPENNRFDLMTTEYDSTVWIPTRPLTPGSAYYWRVRAHDGIFYGPWSNAITFDSGSPIVTLGPERADNFDINLRPEEPQEREKITAISLAAFQAEGLPQAVHLSWSVLQDGDGMGVIVMRGNAEDGPFEPISGTQPFDGEFSDRAVTSGVTYWYRLLVPSADGSSRELGLVSGAAALPDEFTVGQNAPNPFNPVTVIPYTLPGESMVSITVYDITGRVVREVIRGEVQGAGWYRLTWDGTDNVGRAVGSGVYVYRVVRTPVTAGQVQKTSESAVRRMTLVR